MISRISKRSLGCSFLTMLISTTGFSQKTPDKPNILIIMTDQQSAEALGCNIGDKYLRTPNMDYLVAHGVSFTNAYCANPLCVPSRSSMFTGRYPHELGIQANDDKINDPAEFPLFGSIFKNAGYATGYFGKWHLPYNIKNTESHGFLSMGQNKSIGVDSLLAEPAIQFLEINQTKPFLLVVSFINPHNICEWARGSELPDGSIGLPPSADKCPPLRYNHLPSKNETDIMSISRTSYQATKMSPVSGFSDDKWRQYAWAYYRMIEKVDEEIGKILTKMRDSGLDKNTVIIFLSDHGDCQGAHGWNQKTVFYEEASKVPFIISYKGVKPRKSDQLVQTGIDLLPSICDFAGIQLPKQLPGLSVKPLLVKDKHPDAREYIVVSNKMVQGEPVNGYKPEPEGRMLRNRRFKYWIYNEGQQRETLYDLKKDPYEMVNLAGDLKYNNDLNKCREQLMEWAKENNDPFLKNLK